MIKKYKTVVDKYGFNHHEINISINLVSVYFSKAKPLFCGSFFDYKKVLSPQNDFIGMIHTVRGMGKVVTTKDEFTVTENTVLFVHIHDCVSFNLAEAINDLKEIYETKQEQLEKDLIELKNNFNCGTLDDEYLKKMLCIVHYYENLAKANDCNIISSECWTGITLGWGANPCLAMCLLADRDIYVTCEWDIHMTITNVLLLSATRGKEKPIQGEFTCRHPENDNAELL